LGAPRPADEFIADTIALDMGSIRPRPGARYDARVLFSCLNPVDWITAIYRRAEDVYRAVLTWSLGHLEEPGDEQEVRLHRPTPTFMSGPSRAAKPSRIAIASSRRSTTRLAAPRRMCRGHLGKVTFCGGYMCCYLGTRLLADTSP
jgi:hypothetical protein